MKIILFTSRFIATITNTVPYVITVLPENKFTAACTHMRSEQQLSAKLISMAESWVCDQIGKNNFVSTLDDGKPILEHEGYVLVRDNLMQISLYFVVKLESGWMFSNVQKISHKIAVFSFEYVEVEPNENKFVIPKKDVISELSIFNRATLRHVDSAKK